MITSTSAPRWRVPMTARRIDENHRVATPLELLFDLTFVVAVAQGAVSLAHEIEAGHVGDGVVHFVMVFFAIWWAWMNFTWFASAYDTDDVPYRLLTLVQMGGVLILAAGIPKGFEGDFGAIVVGYFVMRIAMVGQWLRAARSDPEHRTAALRYAVLISVVQVLWLLRLFIDDDETLAYGSFFVLALAEISVPMVAERSNMTTWHPHHIAERYGLFTIIVLGECVMASMLAVETGIEELGWTTDVIVVFVAGLVTLFSLWWIYFLKPAGEGLESRRQLSFYWGYGHFFLHGALGALAAGLEVGAAAMIHHLEISETVVALSVAVPVALFLVLVWGLNAPLWSAEPADAALIGLTAIAVLALAALLPAAEVPLSWTLLLMTVPLVALIGQAVVRGKDHSRSA